MVGVLIVSLWVILVLISLVNRNSKFLTSLLYIFMWVIYTFCNSGNPDLDVYTWTYADHIYVTAPGFDLLMNLFASLGMPFYVFKGFCGAFTLYFYKSTFKKFFEHENATMAMCMICPFIASISQIRNGMMSAYVLYAFSEMLVDEKNRVVPYIIRIVLIAFLIHPAGIVYLVLIFARKNYKELGKTKLLFSILLIFMVELIMTQNLLINIARLFISNEKYLQWFDFASGFAAVNDETLNIKGKLLPIIEQLVGTGLVAYSIGKYQYNCNDNYEYSDKDIHILTQNQLYMIKNAFFLLLFLLPFYQISPTYFRIYLNFVPVLYLVVFQLVGKAKARGTLPRSIFFWMTIIYGTFITISSSLGFTMSMFDGFKIG